MIALITDIKITITVPTWFDVRISTNITKFKRFVLFAFDQRMRIGANRSPVSYAFSLIKINFTRSNFIGKAHIPSRRCGAGWLCVCIWRRLGDGAVAKLFYLMSTCFDHEVTQEMASCALFIIVISCLILELELLDKEIFLFFTLIKAFHEGLDLLSHGLN